MSTIFINDLFLKFRDKTKKALSEKQIIHSVRVCNVIAAIVATLIALGNVDIVTMNTFAFAIRCAGPFAAYGLGLVVKKAIPQSGIISIIAGTIGVVFWQIISNGEFYMGIVPVVFGCAVGTLTFFIVNWIGWSMATSDLNEMVSADLGNSNVNIIAETGGAKQWKNSVVSNKTLQRWKVVKGGLEPLDQNVGAARMTDPDTLSSFIRFAAEKYPADRYMYW